jgi:hypothetical protein
MVLEYFDRFISQPVNRALISVYGGEGILADQRFFRAARTMVALFGRMEETGA